MTDLKRKTVILWDFDGVILNSMAVRDQGFVEVLKDFPDEQVDKLLDFHRANGGLSRYVKFRYFFEEIRGGKITEAEIAKWAERFSQIMKSLLTNKKLLIEETLKFIEVQHKERAMHIVSGSDQNELRFLCEELGISRYFKSIQGSPIPKIALVKDVLLNQKYKAKNCVLIGDSNNDYEAAYANGVDFLAYNNPILELEHSVFKPWHE